MSIQLETRPDPAEARPWRFPKVERSTLSTGMGLAVCHLPGQAVIELRLVIRGGARSDPAGLEGLGFITGRALAEGTERLDVDDFAVELETLGARLSSELRWDALVLNASSPRSRLSALLELLAEVVVSPGFREENVARLVALRRDEASRARRFPQARVGEVYSASLFAPGSRRAISSAGTPESVAGIDAGAVRDHWLRVGHPDRATLAVVGDVEGLDISALVQRAFNGWRGSAPAPEEPLPIETRATGSVHVVDMPGAVQTQLAVGLAFPTVELERRPALQLAVHALGGHFNSTLMTELREHRGVTYGVSASVDHSGGASQVTVSTGLQTDATADSLEEILRQLREAPTEEAIAQAIDNLVRTGPTSFRSASAVASAVVRNTIESLPDDYDDAIRTAIAATSPAEAAAALASVLRADELVFAAVGDSDRILSAIEAITSKTANVEPL